MCVCVCLYIGMRDSVYMFVYNFIVCVHVCMYVYVCVRVCVYCERNEPPSVFNAPEFRYIYIYLFQIALHSINVLNVSTCI